MALPFSLFLALKYLKPKRTFLSIISVISAIGVMLGVAVLIVVLSVMSGFDDMWREKILGFDAHILITQQGIIDEPEEMAKKVGNVSGVSAVAPCVQGLVFVKHDDMVYTPLMRGVDIEAEKRMSRLPTHMVSGAFELGEDEVIVGRELARRLRLKVGEKLLVFSPQTFVAGRDEITLPLEMKVAGIFEIGMWEYDIGFILLPLAAARDLYGMESGVHALRVMTSDPYQAGKVARQISAALQNEYDSISVQPWMELNRQLFDALRVEKNMMFFLLNIIVLVAAFGITNSLIIIVVQKTKEIGLLKAVGFSSGSVMRVFLWQGLIQGIIGTAFGIALGLIVLHYRNAIMHALATMLQMELFPKELYHLSEIPARTAFMDVALIALLSVMICTLAGLLPAWRAARLDPARALRYE
ncbi:MAG: FtsX-like permease family protein [Kiritimatiellia bacterium]|nr:FtsX-like permease family protein [Kiritimatiellia bacterium]